MISQRMERPKPVPAVAAVVKSARQARRLRKRVTQWTVGEGRGWDCGWENKRVVDVNDNDDEIMPLLKTNANRIFV